MDESITILAGVLAVLVIFDHIRRLRMESERGRVPVVDTMDMLLLILSIAVLLTIAAASNSSESLATLFSLWRGY